MKKLLVGTLKLTISLVILGYLFYVARNDQSFADLWSQPKDWPLLASALGITLASVMLTFVRWNMLVRALGMPFSMRDAFRLGFLSYLFNFFSLGVIGGDVLKSVFIARQQPRRRTEAVASVVVDRAIGLFALLCVGSASFLFVDLEQLSVRDPNRLGDVRVACQALLMLTIGLALGFVLVMIPRFVASSFWDSLQRIPLVGGILFKLLGAVRIYSQRRGLMLVTLAMSLVVHLLNTLAVYLIAVGLPGNQPSFASHFVIVPIAMAASAVPLPGGLGAFEYVLDFLYRGISSVDVSERQGFVIALGFRVVQIAIAAIGLVYYLVGRREVASLMREAEQQEGGAAAPEIVGELSGSVRAEAGGSS